MASGLPIPSSTTARAAATFVSQAYLVFRLPMQSSTSLPTDLYVRSHFSTMLADMQSLAATMSLPYPSSNSSTASSRIFLSCFGGIKKPPISRTLLSCPRNGRQFNPGAPSFSGVRLQFGNGFMGRVKAGV